MKFRNIKICIISLFFLVYSSFCNTDLTAPRLTVIFVVDGMAHHYIQKLRDKLTGGLKFLLDNGIVYENAYYPHATPKTGIGHVALNVGTFAKDHGITDNSWFENGKEIYFPEDSSPAATVFSKDGTPMPYGRSGKRIMIEGISDHFVMYPKASGKNYAISLSFKDRSAIGTVGSLGKAIWYDKKVGCFTSSKAYFDTLPSWVVEFNNAKKIDQIKKIVWYPAYCLDTPYYKFKNAFNYEFASKKSVLCKEVDELVITPLANNLLFDLAKKCIETFLYNGKNNRLLLWVSFSPLDKVGHVFGPNSAEAIDIIYHIDKRMKRFIDFLQTRINKKDVLFALTADHGVDPIPELLKQEGLRNAARIDRHDFVNKINALVEKRFGIPKTFVDYDSNKLFLTPGVFDNIDDKKKNNVEKLIKRFVKGQSFVKNVWTYDELANKIFKRNTIEGFFKNQLYPGRSGDFLVQLYPYCQITKYKKGTSHYSPYECSTHVPLLFYQKDAFEGRIVHERVSMLQFANSLAQILQVPKSPASTFDILPGLFACGG
ncbi:alkaline phosphatase family protein [Candidatus Dependentiae bacterium]